MRWANCWCPKLLLLLLKGWESFYLKKKNKKGSCAVCSQMLMLILGLSRLYIPIQASFLSQRNAELGKSLSFLELVKCILWDFQCRYSALLAFVFDAFLTGFWHISLATLELTILSPQPLTCWDSRCVVPYLSYCPLYWGGVSLELGESQPASTTPRETVTPREMEEYITELALEGGRSVGLT